jgi:hypothetical protein
LDIGFSRRLPFDPRLSFEAGLSDVTPPLKAHLAAKIAASEQIVCDLFLPALSHGAAILRDVRVRLHHLRRARRLT